MKRVTGALAWIMAGLVAAVVPQPVSSAAPEWTPVGPGVDYREYILPGPVRAYVARMDRANPQVTIDSALAQGQLGIGRETVSQMAARYEQVINAWGGNWGPRNHVLVTINGSFFNTKTGYPESGVLHSGWYTKWYTSLAGGSGFAWTNDRQAFIGQCVYARPERQVVTFLSSGVRMSVSGMDVDADQNNMVIYTPEFYHDGAGGTAQVLVEMSRTVSVMPLPAMVKGTIRKITDEKHVFAIPFDHIVMAAKGLAARSLLDNAHVGEEIGVSLEISDLGADCKTPITLDWTKAYAGVGGSFDFLRDGEIRSFTDPGATNRNPRTAVCFNDNQIDFIVVDGRQPGWSDGMTIDELARFCKVTLSDDNGINQDGGGSSAMWVAGRLVNRPSDGHERAVGNGLMMIEVKAMEKSGRFRAGDRVLTQKDGSMRLGPGSNFETVGDVLAGSEVTILPQANDLGGILATGSFWWEVGLGNRTGWMEESQLTRDGVGTAVFVVGSPAIPRPSRAPAN
jgi:hypothetical protein